MQRVFMQNSFVVKNIIFIRRAKALVKVTIATAAEAISVKVSDFESLVLSCIIIYYMYVL